MFEEERNIFSWEIPRSTSEICKALRYAILDQWSVPAISPEENCEGYDHDPNHSSFEIHNFKTKYKVTIEKIS